MPSTTYTHGASAYRNHKCRCDICKAAKAEARRMYRRANKDKVAEDKREYRQANKDKVAEYNWAYYRANKEKMAEYHRAYYRANKEKMAEYHRAAKHRRRARKADNGIFTILDGEWNRTLQRHRHECFYCGAHHRDSPLTVDHIIPIAKGGRHAIGNLIPACHSCNSSKHARLLVEWKHRG